MFRIKILFTALLVLIGTLTFGLLGQTQTSQKPQKLVEKTKMPDVSPELREKAFVLLEEVVKETEHLKLPQNRLEIKIRAADLLWEKDEEQGRKLFLEVNQELENLRQDIEKNDCLSGEIRTFDCSVLSYLEFQLVDLLTERDVKTAEVVLSASNIENYNSFLLEKKIFEKYLSINPQKAFDLARKDFIGKELPYSDANTVFKPISDFSFFHNYGKLTALYLKSPELGAKLALEIFENLKSKKISVQPRISNTTSTNIVIPFDNSNIFGGNFDDNRVANANSRRGEFSQNRNSNENSFSQVSGFLQLVDHLNSETKKRNPKQVLILPDNLVRELALNLMNSLKSMPQFDYYDFALIYPVLKKYAPNETEKLRERISPEDQENFERQIKYGNKSNLENRKSAEDIAKEAETTTGEKRDALYAEASKEAANCCQCSNESDGLKYYIKIENKEKFTELNEIFEEVYREYQAINGNENELRKILSLEKDSMKKVELLSLTGNALAKNGKYESAKKLLSEAKSLLPEKHSTSLQLRARAVYAGAVSSVDAEQSFILFENLIPQADENIKTVANFYLFKGETEYLRGGEFPFNLIEFQSARHTYPSAPMIKNLSRTDFERTVKLADKFSRHEIRLFARWHIAESLLFDQAEINEKAIADYREGC